MPSIILMISRGACEASRRLISLVVLDIDSSYQMGFGAYIARYYMQHLEEFHPLLAIAATRAPHSS